MKVFVLSLALFLIMGHAYARAGEGTLLWRALDGLNRALEYVERTIHEVNLDAILCVRQVEAQLEAYLKYQPEVFLKIRHSLEDLKRKTRRIADRGMKLVYKTEPENSARIGFLMAPVKKAIWYSSDVTLDYLVEEPVSCPLSYLNGTISDICFSELQHRGEFSPCKISAACLEMRTERGQREYTLTHQVLQFILMEEFLCWETVPRELRLRFCSNVMRDAKIIERSNYLESHRDLMMEQIGLCGFWGFKDFYKAEWLERILDWQLSSGCFGDKTIYKCLDMGSVENNHPRFKRTEKVLSDGCLSHETGVALMALVVSIRFEAEYIYDQTARGNPIREGFPTLYGEP